MAETCEECKKSFKKFNVKEETIPITVDGNNVDVPVIAYCCPHCGEHCYEILDSKKEVIYK